MRTFKSVLVISSAVFFSIACTSETTNQNINQNSATASNANAVPAPAPPAAAVATPASANANQPAKPADTKPAAAAKPVSNIDAAALFTSNKCVTCHGADGKGKVKGTPNFSDAAWQKKEKDGELIEAIKKGKKPMPPYAGKLSDDEIKALVAYVRTFAKN